VGQEAVVQLAQCGHDEESLSKCNYLILREQTLPLKASFLELPSVGRFKVPLARIVLSEKSFILSAIFFIKASPK